MRAKSGLEFTMRQLDKVLRSFNLPIMTFISMQIAGLPYKETAVLPQHISAAAQKVDLLRFGSASHTSIGKIAAKSYTLVLKKANIGGEKNKT